MFFVKKIKMKKNPDNIIKNFNYLIINMHGKKLANIIKF